ncbi:MAG: radical SAM protein [Candidatus Margulisbacteria bacterium]|nr:radical SAM protein [Candidatus Margulisiibacteriota bacterium]
MAHIATTAGPDFKFFSGKPFIPRQMEVHLPNDRGVACNLACTHCQGKYLKLDVASKINYDAKLMDIIKMLGGKIPLFVISGAYTEPTLSSNLESILETIKTSGANFGLHTNGVLLPRMERNSHFLQKLFDMATEEDYVTLSLDAGDRNSYNATKGVSGNYFDRLLEALKIIYAHRKGSSSPLSIRVTYLLNEHNSSLSQLAYVKQLMTDLGVDSLRFSIPYAYYGASILECLEYRILFERPFYEQVWPNLSSLLSTSREEKPLIFALPPDTQDIGMLFSFNTCFIGYFSMTLGADGHFYRCSSSAFPSFPGLRLGKLDDALNNIEQVFLANQSLSFDPLQSCFPHGARCNRVAMDINDALKDRPECHGR